jgi:hypothetical protein
MAFDNVIIKVQYFGKNFQLVLADKKNHQLTTGYILLSKTGKELLPICGAEPFDYYLELIINAWKKRDIESFKFIDQ